MKDGSSPSLLINDVIMTTIIVKDYVRQCKPNVRFFLKFLISRYMGYFNGNI